MAPIPKTMRAVVCATPGPISVLKLQDIPIPTPLPGQILIKVLGFGINRAEMFTRQGLSPDVTFPRTLGIECVGTVVGYPSGTTTQPFPIGTRVATLMGGLGRQIPGSYAEYTCAGQENVRAVPATKNLSVAQLAALPEMLQTTWGSLQLALDLKKGESLLVRGATSSIGLCAIQLARYMGASRIGATTRQPARESLLKDAGADEVFIDSGTLAEQVQKTAGGGFDKVLELVGASTLKDSVKCAAERGIVCMTGIQGGSWVVDSFYPSADLPNRVLLCAYAGGPRYFHAMPWEDLVKEVDEGRIKIPVRAFKLEDIQQVHELMESGGGGSKMVVVVAEE